MRVLLLTLCCLLVGMNGLYEDFFKMDFAALLRNETKVTQIFDCIVDRGPCTDYTIIKDTLPGLYLSNCSDCSPEQKKIFEQYMKHLTKKYPQQTATLANSLRSPSNLSEDASSLFYSNDVLGALTDPSKVKHIFECLMDRGNCSQYRVYKDNVPNLFNTRCAGCTPEQKKLFGTAMLEFSEKYPKEFKEFTEKLKQPMTEEDKWFMCNFTKLTDLTVAKEVADCAVDRCEQHKSNLEMITKLYKNKCVTCSEDNKEKFSQFVAMIREHLPLEYMQFIEKLNKTQTTQNPQGPQKPQKLQEPPNNQEPPSSDMT